LEIKHHVKLAAVLVKVFLIHLSEFGYTGCSNCWVSLGL